jgi:F0F1-type ATP synthase assembly protein I
MKELRKPCYTYILPDSRFFEKRKNVRIIMRQTRRPLQAMAHYAVILSQQVGSILIGVCTGMWLDSKIGTTPLF